MEWWREAISGRVARERLGREVEWREEKEKPQWDQGGEHSGQRNFLCKKTLKQEQAELDYSLQKPPRGDRGQRGIEGGSRAKPCSALWPGSLC